MHGVLLFILVELLISFFCTLCLLVFWAGVALGVEVGFAACMWFG